MKRLALMLAAGLAFPLAAQAQTSVDAGVSGARADGKAFGQQQAGAAQSAATTQPDAERVPGYSGNSNQSGYFDDPDRLARDAASQASTNTGYQAMRD